MKTVILAGGLGTRLSEYTESIPKPMVTIGGKPILWHIMSHYAKYGHKDFVIALGYKASVVRDYFLNYKALNSDFTINLSSGDVISHGSVEEDWNVTLVHTGDASMTGGRIRRLQPFLDGERFLCSYGDGVSNVDLGKLIAHHSKNKSDLTLTAVRPTARFGELTISGDIVTGFSEKPQIQDGWVNGGFFVMEPCIFNFLEDDQTILERNPLERMAVEQRVGAYKHYGYWQCMDTKRDHDALEKLWNTGKAPWLI
jgi:glucose-1-phosphate cytidylyltransferase